MFRHDKYRSILAIFFRVTSLALGQSYDCPSATEVTLKKMGKGSYESIRGDNMKTKRSAIKLCAYSMGYTLSHGIAI